MEAVILAGGFGTRMVPLTYTRPKVMLPIFNRPMIEYIIDLLPQSVNTVIIASNYKVEFIKDYFNTNKKNKNIIINVESKPLGTGGAVKFCEKYISSEQFLVLNSDIVSSISIQNFIDFHIKEKAFITISLWPVENVREYGVVKIENSRIVYFVEKPKPEEAPSNLINAGAYCINKDVIDYIPSDTLVSMEKEIFPKVISDKKKFCGYRFDGYWIDVGRYNDYINAHKKLLVSMNKLNYIDCDVDIDKNVSMRYAIIHKNTNIKTDTKIECSVILENCEIEENVIIENSIIGVNCKIEKNSKIINSIIGDNNCVHQNSNIENTRYWNYEIPKGYPSKQIGNVIDDTVALSTK